MRWSHGPAARGQHFLDEILVAQYAFRGGLEGLQCPALAGADVDWSSAFPRGARSMEESCCREPESIDVGCPVLVCSQHAGPYRERN
jgi:hypothetical protein